MCKERKQNGGRSGGLITMKTMQIVDRCCKGRNEYLRLGYLRLRKIKNYTEDRMERVLWTPAPMEFMGELGRRKMACPLITSPS